MLKGYVVTVCTIKNRLNYFCSLELRLYSIIGHIRKNTYEMIRDKWIKKSSGGNQANGTNMVGAKMEDFFFFSSYWPCSVFGSQGFKV